MLGQRKEVNGSYIKIVSAVTKYSDTAMKETNVLQKLRRNDAWKQSQAYSYYKYMVDFIKFPLLGLN